MEKKCETCVFCTQKPENLSFLPNEWICGCFSCKWFNYWPPTGVCENYAEPTGKTVEEVLGELGKQAYDGVRTLLSAMWGNNSSDEYVEKFMQEDSAVLSECRDAEKEERNKAEEMRKELESASRPLVEYLYKYGSPHSKIIVQMDGAEMVSGECACRFEVRD